MELQVLISKKGTKVVTATNLHLALQLPNQHYATHVKRWLGDIYEFKDGIRKPSSHKDYAKRIVKDNPILDDYYLSIELAKLITLNSKSKVKQKYAKRLLALEDKVENAELLTKEQVLNVIELAKVMGLISCQESCERKHLKTYEERNGGSAENWWRHRGQILGYDTNTLKNKARKFGKKDGGQSQRRLLMQLDKHETIRTGVIDLMMALGKNERYARNIGDLAKVFAKELNIEIHDDRNAASLFEPPINPDLLQEVKACEKKRHLEVW